MDFLSAEQSDVTREQRRPSCGPAPTPREQRAVRGAHDDVHRHWDGVVACWFAPSGCPPESLCGQDRQWAIHPFAGASLPGDEAFDLRSMETWGALTRSGAGFSARLPVEADGLCIGHVLVLATSPPDVETMARIESSCAARSAEDHDSGWVAAADPLPELGADEQEALLELFEAEPGSQPTVRCPLQRAARAIGGPVVVQTSRFVVIDAIGDISGISLDSSSHRDHDAAALATRSVGPILVPGRGEQSTRALVKIRADRGRPHLLVAEVDKENTWGLAVLRQAAGILSWVLRMARDSNDDVSVRRAALVADLARGHDLTGVSARSAVLGHDLHTPHRPFAFLVHEDPDESSLRRIEQIVAESFRSGAVAGPEPLVAACGRYVIALVPEYDRATPEVAARQCLAAARREGQGLVCGVGPSSLGPESLSEGIQQAQRAAEVLRHAGRPDSVVSYEDLGIFGFLFSEADRGRIDAFVERWLGPLVEHDAHSNADLVRTIEAILDHPTMMAAANALYIHISTLKYRCKRIEDILAVDMREPEVTFNLRLAMKLSAIRDGLSENRT